MSAGATARWMELTGRPPVRLPHDDATGTVDVEAAALTHDVRVVSIVHTSPVTGMSVDVPGIAAAVRAVAPDAFIVVDGSQAQQLVTA